MIERHEVGKPWSLRDAAEYLGVSAKSLERASVRGEITFRRIGRRILISDADVRRLAGDTSAVTK